MLAISCTVRGVVIASIKLGIGMGMVMRARTIALAIAVSSMAFCSAHGADLPASPYPPSAAAPVAYSPVSNGPWTGFYFGGNVGEGWANATGNYTLAGNAFINGTLVGNPVNFEGANGGVQAGYNWQTGILLIGLEADIQGAGESQTFNYVCGVACSVTQTVKIDGFGTFRGRAGFAVKDVLFYGTGGLNWTHGENNFYGALNGASANLADFTHNSLGWTAGGGLEWMFARWWSVKVEYLRLQNNNSAASLAVPSSLGGGTLTNTASASNNIVRAGVNMHFPFRGWPYGW
jgi:outer membrane immunogenic protein